MEDSAPGVSAETLAPRYIDDPGFGRLVFVPQAPPVPSYWRGQDMVFGSHHVTRIEFEVYRDCPVTRPARLSNSDEPPFFQEAMARMWLRGFRRVFLPRLRPLLEEVSVRLSAQELAALCPFDEDHYHLVLLHLPYDPTCQGSRMHVRDLRTPRYEIALAWLNGELINAEVVDGEEGGLVALDGAPLAELLTR